MSLCSLMVLDFRKGWGRHCEETGKELYSDSDLRFGIVYAEGLIEEGYTHEPFHGYDLREFVEWAREKLR